MKTEKQDNENVIITFSIRLVRVTVGKEQLVVKCRDCLNTGMGIIALKSENPVA